MAIERAKYRVYNGTEFDEIHFKTSADLVEIKDTAGKFTATEVEGALKENADKIGNLNGIIGSLSSLVTTVKTSIVNAINEIKNELTSHKNNKNNPHNVTAAQVGAALSSHSHAAGDLPSASTSAKGIVQLSTSTSSTSTTLAATASAVRTVNNNLSNKVDKPSSATSGNIAVFDGGPGKIKDGGITTTNIRTSFYKASGHTTLTFSNVSSRSASPVREISIPAGSRVRVWLTISYGALGPYAACIETTPGVRGSFDSTYFVIPVAITQGAEANSSRTNQDGDFMLRFESTNYLFFKYLTNNKLMFFVYNNHSSDTYSYTLNVYWYILD